MTVLKQPPRLFKRLRNPLEENANAILYFPSRTTSTVDEQGQERFLSFEIELPAIIHILSDQNTFLEGVSQKGVAVRVRLTDPDKLSLADFQAIAQLSEGRAVINNKSGKFKIMSDLQNGYIKSQLGDYFEAIFNED